MSIYTHTFDLNVQGKVESTKQGRLIGAFDVMPMAEGRDNLIVLYNGSEIGYTKGKYYISDGTSWSLAANNPEKSSRYGSSLKLNPADGRISLLDQNGVELSAVDTTLERIVKSGYYDANTNELVLVLDDNSEIRIDASKLVDVYTADGETIVESGHVFALSPGSKDALQRSADHIADTSNPHGVTKAQVGLGNVDNTSDAKKPISEAMQSALNLKANDDAVVHKTGNEDISGIKRFDDVRLRTPLTLEPASYLTKRLQIVNQDTNDVIGYYGLAGDNTSTRTYISVFRKVNGETVYSDLQAHLKADGTKYALAPTWNAGTADNSDKILTTKMANSLPSLVHTTSNETIAGNKTFSSPITVDTTSLRKYVLATEIPDRDVTPSEDYRYDVIRVEDAKIRYLAGMYAYSKTNNTKGCGISVRHGSVFSELKVVSDNDTTYATAPVTTDTAPDDAIVTKKYLLDKIAALEARIATLEAKP